MPPTLLHMTIRNYVILVVVLFILPACVSKKKYNDEVRRRLEVEDRNLQYTAEVRAVGQRSDRINGTIARLENELAEERARAAARIAALERDIVKLKGNQADTERQGNARVAALETELQTARAELTAVEALFAQRRAAIDQHYTRLAGTLTGYPPTALRVVRETDGVRVDIAADVLFHRGKYGRIRTDGRQLLTAVAFALQDNREQGLVVEGVDAGVGTAQQLAAGTGAFLVNVLGWAPADLRYTALQQVPLPAENTGTAELAGSVVRLKVSVPPVVYLR